MTDLSITAANVTARRGATIVRGIAGATITAGQVVYKNATTGKYELADADGAAALRVGVGIALHAASNNQPLAIITKGGLNAGATVAIGTVYALADEPGAICPVADLANGDYVTTLGIGVTTSRIDVNIQVSGVAVPAP